MSHPQSDDSAWETGVVRSRSLTGLWVGGVAGQFSNRATTPQFRTRYFVLYVGWTLDFIHQVWSGPRTPHHIRATTP